VLLPACLLVGAFAVVQAQTAGSASRWSDPATWPNRKVPAAGDKVTIPEGKNVVLDVTPPALGGLTIEGKLSFANTADVELTTEWIMLHGELAIGTEASPHTRKATITFTNTVPDEEPMKGMGDRGIMIMGGTLNLHGDRKNAWTKLSQTAAAGSTSSRSWTPPAGAPVTRSSSPPRTSIRGRPSGARLPASRAMRSRSTRNWTTCTSARSPSASMNAAKSVC
jgi:hypothetical protein